MINGKELLHTLMIYPVPLFENLEQGFLVGDAIKGSDTRFFKEHLSLWHFQSL